MPRTVRAGREGSIGRSRRAVRVTIARTFGFGVGNDKLGFSLLLAVVVRPVAVLGALAVSTDPSGEPGRHQSPLISLGRAVLLGPVRVASRTGPSRIGPSRA